MPATHSKLSWNDLEEEEKKDLRKYMSKGPMRV